MRDEGRGHRQFRRAYGKQAAWQCEAFPNSGTGHFRHPSAFVVKHKHRLPAGVADTDEALWCTAYLLGPDELACCTSWSADRRKPTFIGTESQNAAFQA